MRFPSPETLAVCERFSLWVRQGGGLPVRGRPVPRGESSGLDFEGYAEYVPGLDLRHLDWGVYARTREFHVRTFADEGAGVLAVLLDASGSMAQPGRWRLARELAAALVFAGLREVHGVLLGVARGAALEALPLSGGVDFAPSAFRFLGEQRAHGETHLGAALGDLPTGFARGDAVVISDFLDPHGAARGLETLAAAGWRADLCRIRAAGELELPPGGAWVVDPEGGGRTQVPEDEAARRAVRDALERSDAALVEAARRRGAVLVDLDAEMPLSAALTRVFTALSGARRA